MAECLEFGIGISSIVFVEINKCISPLFFYKKKNKYMPYCQLLKTKQAAKTKNQTKNTQTNQTKAFRWHKQSIKLPLQRIRHLKASSLLITLWKPTKAKQQRYDSGDQQYHSV